tara:strand:- start:949 stop:1131 length:183 start_codon:yes stop_codon:yes gene_type:complete
MKLELNEISFIKDCIWNTTIKGSDSVFVGDLIKKILKEGNRLTALEKKKQSEMQEVYIKE